jgi:Dyp-type peroxidase family
MINQIDLINPMDFSNDELLSDLQGNILKGHGRHHTIHIFVHFDSKRQTRASEWIREFSKNHVTSCKKQLRDRELFKRNKVDGGIFSSVFFTAKGYKYFKPEEEIKLTDAAFLAGMKNRLAVNNDPIVSKWEKGFREETHVMILLADTNPNRMGKLAQTVLNELDKFAHICSVEYGNAIFNANGDGLEHFGYVDGISQPLFLQDEVDDYMSFHGISPTNSLKFDPSADKDLVLIKDPYSPNEKALGSYFVFRKLEQHVLQFKKAEKALASRTGYKKEFSEIAGAFIVGRFEDGTPVEMSPEDAMIGSGNFNNFDYDPSGGKCPHFAHVRKMNPRHNIPAKDRYEKEDDHKSHIMARRGIPFGHREVSTEIDPNFAQMPKGNVGLLFMSYQKSIVNQFEFIQQNWANQKDFEIDATGIDPIIGQSKIGENVIDRQYKLPTKYGETILVKSTDTKPDDDKKPDFDQFVDMKGGEYFFAPSISFLNSIEAK